MHILPIITTLTNIVLSDAKFIKDDWQIILVIGIVYAGVNYISSMALDKPVYSIVTW
jgi:endonuclease V-like protein UPF0215 family